MKSDARSSRVFQAPNLNSGFAALVIPRFARNDEPVLRYPNEKFLARETGTIVVFMVGLCRGGPDQLDWCAQLRCAQQSAQNGEER